MKTQHLQSESPSGEEEKQKADLIFKVNTYNTVFFSYDLKEGLFALNTKYPKFKLKILDDEALEVEKEPTTFTLEEMSEQFKRLEQLKQIISTTPSNPNKDPELKIIAEYKVILLHVIYEAIKDPNRMSYIPVPPNTKSPKTLWDYLTIIGSAIADGFNWVLKRLQFLALALTKLAAIFLPLLVTLTEGVPYIASLFSVQVTFTAAPGLLAFLAGASAFLSLISVYYYLPYLLQWLGITSPSLEKPLLQLKQEECLAMERINNRLEHTILNFHNSQYQALLDIINPINREIIDLKLPEHKRAMRVKFVRLGLGIFNIVASAHSAVGVSSLFSTATILTSSFAGTGAAATLTTLAPILLPIATAVLFIGFFTWAQFLVSQTVLNALDPEGAAHARLKDTLDKFDAPDPTTFQQILSEKIKFEKANELIKQAEAKAKAQAELVEYTGHMLEHKLLRKKEPMHSEMYKTLSASSNQPANGNVVASATETKSPNVDTSATLPLWKKLKLKPVDSKADATSLQTPSTKKSGGQPSSGGGG